MHQVTFTLPAAPVAAIVEAFGRVNAAGAAVAAAGTNARAAGELATRAIIDGAAAIHAAAAESGVRVWYGDGRGRAARKARPTNLLIAEALESAGMADKGQRSAAAKLTTYIAMTPALADLCVAEAETGKLHGYRKALQRVEAFLNPDGAAAARLAIRRIAEELTAMIADGDDGGLSQALAKCDPADVADWIADRLAPMVDAD